MLFQLSGHDIACEQKFKKKWRKGVGKKKGKKKTPKSGEFSMLVCLQKDAKQGCYYTTKAHLFCTANIN